jgi:PKD repeat protein
VASWAWDFGDGATGAGKTASHTYAAAGTYTVKLTVTDGAGATGTVSRAVTVAAAANTAPTAAFASSVSGLAVSVDGSGSTDPDGAVASWAWDFGDGATGAGKTASHTYAAAGTYTVKLTVTDGAGATGTVSRAVTVAAPAPVPGGALASDAFGRTVTGGWGAADAGGTWTVAGTVANASVGNGSGGLVAAKGGWIATDLPISAQDVAVQADVSLTAAPTGGGTYVNLGGRNTGGNQYNAQLWFASDGTAELSLLSVVSGAEKELGSFALAGKYTVGSALRVRLDLSGTTLHAKAWPASAAEPAGWQLTATDSTAALQKAGGLEVQLYQSSSATTTQTVRVDNLWAGAAGTTPAP